jgi:hypothetical protein
MVLPLSGVPAESISLPLMLTVNGMSPDVGLTLIETDVDTFARALTVMIWLLAMLSPNI